MDRKIVKMNAEALRIQSQDCIDAIEAHERGEPVEGYDRDKDSWYDTAGVPMWYSDVLYRPASAGIVEVNGTRYKRI